MVLETAEPLYDLGFLGEIAVVARQFFDELFAGVVVVRFRKIFELFVLLERLFDGLVLLFVEGVLEFLDAVRNWNQNGQIPVAVHLASHLTGIVVRTKRRVNPHYLRVLL